MVCSRAYKLLLTGSLEIHDKYDPECRHKISLFINRLSPNVSDLLDSFERSIWKYLNLMGLSNQLLATHSEMDFGDVLPSLEKQLNFIPQNLKMLRLEQLNENKNLGITILVSGWLSENDDQMESWSKMMYSLVSMNAFALRWSASHKYKPLEKLKKNASTSILNTAKKMVKATWDTFRFIKTRQKAKQTGRVLAMLIQNGMIWSKVPISFIGFSLGTQVILSCLKELAKSDMRMVQDVILIGSAVSCNQKNLVKAKSVTYGRMFNVFSHKDRALQLGFKVVTGKTALGTCMTNVPGITNFDASSIAGGHTQYRKNLGKIFKGINY